MKAAVVRRLDQAPRYETWPDPEHPAGQPLEVLAAALSPRVRSAASGRHYTQSGFTPHVPGLDAVGRLADGRRVYFLAVDEMFGTMAERTWADERLMVPIPEGLSAPLVAAAMIPAISSWVALTRRAPLRPGQSVLVLGATGTSGQLAVQIAKRLGAGRVLAAARDVAALERVRRLGADAVTPLDPEAVAALASEVDVVLDYLWGDVTSSVMPALCRHREDESRALRWVSIGSVAGESISLSSTLLRKRNLQVMGSGQGASTTSEMFSVAPEIVAALAAGALTCPVRELPLSDVERGWTMRCAAGERLVFVNAQGI